MRGMKRSKRVRQVGWTRRCDRDEGVATKGGGTCVRGSEGLEDVAGVWLCLVHSLDRSLVFLL